MSNHCVEHAKTYQSTHGIIDSLATFLLALCCALGTTLVIGSASAQDVEYGFAVRMGGDASDGANAIATDASGNVYTTGLFTGTVDFDPGAGVVELTSVDGSLDVFVQKLDSDGNLLWARAMGGTSTDRGLGIAVDADGNVYTTGYFTVSADFDPGPATVTIFGNAGSKDIFVSKLDANGNFVWAGAMGGTTTNDSGDAIAVDTSGNVYTTGRFLGTADFNPGAGTSNLVSIGSDSIFVSKLDSDGVFVWAKAMGGFENDQGAGIALDGPDNVYTTGYFGGTADFDPGEGTANLNVSVNKIFVSKLDSAGAFVWGKAMGGLGPQSTSRWMNRATSIPPGFSSARLILTPMWV